MKASYRIAGIVAVALSSVLLIALTFLYDWFPAQLSPSSEKVDTLYKFLVAVSVPFVVVIFAFIAYCLIEFRAKPDDPDDKDGEPIHGSTRLEIIWTTIPLIVVVALGIYAWIVLDDIEAKPLDEMKINVVAQQFVFNYEYPDQKITTSNELVVPVNKPLVFKLTSQDVIHSFWVPAARLKRDMTPGPATKMRFKPEKTGTYPIVCTELCGVGHAVMRSQLRVVSQAEFDKWVKQQQTGGGKPAGGGGDGKAVFAANACGGCHTLAAANASGAAGPKLDGLGFDAAAMRESIVNPDAKIAKGFSKGIMPPTFGKTIPKKDLDALVDFLVKAGKE
ncbi:MAG: cytochrome c oxidase subunit II [Phycisphaerales bacterium]|nr:cytochrome c oxidase subunit II [Phycisphaerales bacterium]